MLYRPNRQRRTSRGGAAATELGFLLLPLAMLLVLTVDFGRIFYYTSVIEACARNGALWACDVTGQTTSPYTNLTDAANADAAGLSPAPTASMAFSATVNGTYTSYASSSAAYNAGMLYVQVTVHWSFKTIMSYWFIPSTYNLQRTVTMAMIPTS